MKKREEVKVKRMVSNEVMAKLLRDLANSFEKGRVCVQGGEEFVSLEPAKHVNMELEASCSKKGKEKLSIELGWKQFTDEGEKARELVISDEEPEVEETSEAGEEDPFAISSSDEKEQTDFS
jgi:amphi-Trp domain-containing protein